MYTRLFPLIFVFLFSINAANSAVVILIDGIHNNYNRTISGDNVTFTFNEKYTPETLVILTIKKSDGSFVKEITLVPSMSRQVATFLNDGKYVVNEYNVVTGKSQSTRFNVH